MEVVPRTPETQKPSRIKLKLAAGVAAVAAAIAAPVAVSKMGDGVEARPSPAASATASEQASPTPAETSQAPEASPSPRIPEAFLGLHAEVQADARTASEKILSDMERPNTGISQGIEGWSGPAVGNLGKEHAPGVPNMTAKYDPDANRIVISSAIGLDRSSAVGIDTAWQLGANNPLATDNDVTVGDFRTALAATDTTLVTAGAANQGDWTLLRFDENRVTPQSDDLGEGNIPTLNSPEEARQYADDLRQTMQVASDQLSQAATGQ